MKTAALYLGQITATSKSSLQNVLKNARSVCNGSGFAFLWEMVRMRLAARKAVEVAVAVALAISAAVAVL